MTLLMLLVIYYTGLFLTNNNVLLLFFLVGAFLSYNPDGPTASTSDMRAVSPYTRHMSRSNGIMGLGGSPGTYRGGVASSSITNSGYASYGGLAGISREWDRIPVSSSSLPWLNQELSREKERERERERDIRDRERDIREREARDRDRDGREFRDRERDGRDRERERERERDVRDRERDGREKERDRDREREGTSKEREREGEKEQSASRVEIDGETAKPKETDKLHDGRRTPPRPPHRPTSFHIANLTSDTNKGETSSTASEPRHPSERPAFLMSRDRRDEDKRSPGNERNPLLLNDKRGTPPPPSHLHPGGVPYLDKRLYEPERHIDPFDLSRYARPAFTSRGPCLSFPSLTQPPMFSPGSSFPYLPGSAMAAVTHPHFLPHGARPMMAPHFGPLGPRSRSPLDAPELLQADTRP